MFSTRITLFVLVFAIVVLFLLFLDPVELYTHKRPQGDSLGSGYAPRPNYPPFQPPSLDESTPPPSLGDHPDDLPMSEDKDASDRLLWDSRAQSVKDAFLHAYHGYERYAPFPSDELAPVTNKSVINFNGWGVTMVDSLDTMLLLGLEAEFQRALAHVASINFRMRSSNHAPFFETVIRYLGGFLSAYAISGEPILLSRAEELAHRLLPAFNTTSGLPVYSVNTETQQHSYSATMLLAEIGSCQMEYKYMAHLTGHSDFFKKSDKIMEILKKHQPAEHGLWPTVFSVVSGNPTGTSYSVGSLADSAYEYLLKQYLLSGKTEHWLAEMYMKSVTGIIENLLYLSPTRNLLYVTDTNGFGGFAPTGKFEHLACFFPGLLALGADELPESIMSDKQRELHRWAAEGLAHSCWVMYADQPSGLGPDIVQFDAWRKGLWMPVVRKWEQDGRPTGKPPGVGNAGMPVEKGGKTDYVLYSSRYLLRPETLESMFVMYRTTKDVKWRERGWQIWEAIEAKTRTPSGYTSVGDIANPDKLIMENTMPSYFLAETVKYAYLLAIDEDIWPADQWVLNTEAHPLPIFSWRDWEVDRFGVNTKLPIKRPV